MKNSTWVGNHTSRPFQQEHLEKILTPGMPSKVDPNKCYTKRNQARRIGKILPVWPSILYFLPSFWQFDFVTFLMENLWCILMYVDGSWCKYVKFSLMEVDSSVKKLFETEWISSLVSRGKLFHCLICSSKFRISWNSS